MKLFETEHWFVDLSSDQAYLGRCYIKIKRDCGDLASLSKEEFLDFFEIVKNLENAFKKSFGATMFNWVCLMNNAYKSEESKPHVHWHFRPRYKNPVNFEGMTFEDTEFAHHYDKDRNMEVSDEILEKIKEKVLENIKIKDNLESK